MNNLKASSPNSNGIWYQELDKHHKQRKLTSISNTTCAETVAKAPNMSSISKYVFILNLVKNLAFCNSTGQMCQEVLAFNLGNHKTSSQEHLLSM